MKTIYKYILPLVDQTTHWIPGGGMRFLTAQYQGQDLCVWVEVNTAEAEKMVSFRIVGTGQPLGEAENYIHINTVIDNNLMVWHVYVKIY